MCSDNYPVNGIGKGIPRLCATLQLGQALRGDGIDFALAPLVLFAPDANDQFVALEGVQCGVEGTFFELESVGAAQLNFAGDGIAVQGAVFKDGQHERMRVSFQKFLVGFHNRSPIRCIRLLCIGYLCLSSGFRRFHALPQSISFVQLHHGSIPPLLC